MTTELITLPLVHTCGVNTVVECIDGEYSQY